MLLSGRYADARPAVQQLQQFSTKLVPLAYQTFSGMLAEQADKNNKAAVDFYEAALKLPANEAYTKEYKYKRIQGVCVFRAGPYCCCAKAYHRNAPDTAEYERPFAK